MHEVSRRAWGLRLRRTEQELALSLLFMLPSAHYKASASGLHLFEAQYPPHLFPCLRFAVSPRGSPAQNSGPSGSLLLSRKALSSSASCRFIPAHCNRDFSVRREMVLSVTTCSQQLISTVDITASGLPRDPLVVSGQSSSDLQTTRTDNRGLILLREVIHTSPTHPQPDQLADLNAAKNPGHST